MKSSDIRKKFLEYFENHGHKKLPSASLIPTDPTVLLTLAGMLPFKPIFLGIESPKYKRVTTVQKCIRMNDIEQVGHTTRHHTFFEMLGNFSFGDYFKEDAIKFAWELLTEGYGIPKDKLVIAVYEKDDEAYDLWEKKMGIPKDRIFRLDAENNFWAAGPTGPCGPCSEIYYDYGGGCGKPTCNPACDCERFLEVWNLVFIEYNRDEKGDLTPLPNKNIDTGMGLERITRVLQDKKDNFDTDIFEQIFKKLPDKSPASKIVADHLRAMTYLIADSVIPSNEGRGYVLRRIIRRAMLYAKKLKLKTPILFELSKVIIDQGKDTYPELSKQAATIQEAIKAEEISFNATLESGMKMIEGLFAKHLKDKIISGEEAFKLHDTYGFPFDITYDLALERGYKTDKAQFDKLMEEQRERARAKASKLDLNVLKLKGALEKKYGKIQFIGYEKSECESKILDVLLDEKVVILDKTPFYPESGGQIGDTGIIGDRIVLGTYGEIGGIILHILEDITGLKVGSKIKVKIDEGKRNATANHHTATHLLQAALRKVFGETVKQSGSFVGPERLRFDYSFNRAMTLDEITQIEQIVNQAIKNAIKVEKLEMSFDEAHKLGAMALFSEKYGDKVRVIRIKDTSIELCGGTHVNNTSDLEFFKILKDEALQAGVRRIEAIAGHHAKVFMMYKAKEFKDQINELMLQHSVLQAKKELLGGGTLLEGNIFSVETTEFQSLSKAIDDKDIDKVNKFMEHLSGRVEWLKDRNKTIVKDICVLEGQNAAKDAEKLLSKVQKIKDIDVISESFCEVNIDNLRIMGDKLRELMKSGIIMLASNVSNKAVFLVIVTDDLTQKGYHAGKLAKIMAETCGGGGGGKANKAEAGGKDTTKIPEALEKAKASL